MSRMRSQHFFFLLLFIINTYTMFDEFMRLTEVGCNGAT